MKSLALNRGFKVKLPYADRIDKNQIRTVNFSGQKKNQADVNKVMEELKAIQGIHEASMKVITDTQA